LHISYVLIYHWAFQLEMYQLTLCSAKLL